MCRCAALQCIWTEAINTIAPLILPDRLSNFKNQKYGKWKVVFTSLNKINANDLECLDLVTALDFAEMDMRLLFCFFMLLYVLVNLILHSNSLESVLFDKLPDSRVLQTTRDVSSSSRPPALISVNPVWWHTRTSSHTPRSRAFFYMFQCV